MLKLTHYAAREVGKRGIGILMERFLFTIRKRSLRRLFFYRCLSVHREGGMCGRGEAWMAEGCMAGDMCGRGCAWQGACMAGGMCGWVAGGHAWWGGMCGRGGACVAGGMRGMSPADTTRYGDRVNERAVRILLECILFISEINKPM